MKEQPSRVRRHHLRVPVFEEEKQLIEQAASMSGKSVAAFMREVAQGYPVRGVMDYEAVRELARINGDLGRLGGLLKLWLTNDERTVQFGKGTIVALLGRIEENQRAMAALMFEVIYPKSEPVDLAAKFHDDEAGEGGA